MTRTLDTDNSPQDYYNLIGGDRHENKVINAMMDVSTVFSNCVI